MTAADDELLAFANRLADQSRPMLQQFFRQPLSIERKPDETPVTAADRAVETALRDHIRQHRPQDGILGEEFGEDGLDREHVWVIDPIDGTKAFASGNPLFGSLIGLLRRGVPVLGVLDAPALGERYGAVVGGGSFRERTRLTTRPTTEIADAVSYTTNPDALVDHDGCRQLRERARWACFGGDCMPFAWLAAGQCDLVVDRGLHVHDWCALVPIVSEAGGELLDWQGRPLTLQSEGDVIAAATPALGQRVRDLLRA